MPKPKYSLVQDQAMDLLPRGTWRPWPIRTPFLASFVCLCIALALTIEAIVRGCSAAGCHVFGEQSSIRVSPQSRWVYTLIPTILSVFFSFIWAIAHHDVMRLEPFFQLSKPGGAAAEDSLLLMYSYKFMLLVPFMALKRRHHVVFLSSCILLVSGFLITPLASGIFDDANLTKRITSAGMRRGIKPERFNLSQQGFTYVAYDYLWGNGSLPYFTTPTYAVLPVTVDTATENEIWSAETTLFEAELNCESAGTADVSHSEEGGVDLRFTSQDGAYTARLCDISMWGDATTLEICNDYTSFFTPWTGISVLFDLNTNSSSLPMSMYAWGSGIDTVSTGFEVSPPPRNLTAVFCKASYYPQPATVTFAMPSRDIKHVNRTASRTLFTGAGRFAEIFKWYFQNVKLPPRYLDSSGFPVGLGFKPPDMPDTVPQLRRMFCPKLAGLLKSEAEDCIDMKGTTTLLSFALAQYKGKPNNLEELLDPHILAETLEATFKLLFAIAVSEELVGGSAEEVTVVRDVDARGYTVNFLWARGAQGGLAFVAIMVVSLIWINAGRGCDLDGEPNSIAAGLGVLTASPELCAGMDNAEFHPEKELRKVLTTGGRRYHLELVELQGPRIQVLNESGEYACLTPLGNDSAEPWKGDTLWTLKTRNGVALVVTLTLVALLLLVVFVYGRAHNGHPTFGGTKSFGYKVLFSYMPVAIGTTIEPTLVSIGSSYCMLWPYEILRRGQAPSTNSLALDYDRSPPHFQLVRPLRAKQTALACLSVAILLTNILTVAFSGLFSPMNANFNIPTQVATYGLPTVSGTFNDPALEMYYALAINITASNSLTSKSAPTWTTEDYYVVPFYPLNNSTEYTYQGPTVAIGADIKCNLLSADMFSIGCNETSITECWMMWGNGAHPVLSIHDPCAETVDPKLPETPSFDILHLSTTCRHTFFAAWVEQPGDPHPGNLPAPYKTHMDAVVLKCVSTEMVYELTASVSETHQVLNVTDIRPLDNQEITAIHSRNNTDLTVSLIEAMAFSTMTQIERASELYWFNYLMASLEPNIIRNLTNVTHIPDTTHLVSVFEDVFRRLFAINLRLFATKVLSPGNMYEATGTVTVVRERVEMNASMFAITMVILFYMVTVLVLLYSCHRPQVEGHKPTSLAGIYAHLYASNAKVPRGSATGRTPGEKARSLEGLYGYGSFRDKGGRRRFGVYREGDEMNDGKDVAGRGT